MAQVAVLRPLCRAARAPAVVAAFGLLAALSLGPASAENTTSPNLAMTPPPGSAYRLNDRAVALGYDVYIGGIYAFHFDTTLSVDDHSYDVTVQGGTTGFIGRMFSWQANMRSAGGLESDKPSPAGFAASTFESATTWQGKPHKTLLRFQDDGRYDVALDPPEEAENARADGGPPTVLAAGTLDPIAASIAALAGSTRDGACARQETVFDGKRYYKLVVRDGDGENVAPPNHLSAYSGPALKCRIAMKRLAGFAQRRYAQYWDDQSSSMPTIWSASLVPDMPMVPVRFLAPINMAGNIGSMMIHIVHAELRENGSTRTILDLDQKKR